MKTKQWFLVALVMALMTAWSVEAFAEKKSKGRKSGRASSEEKDDGAMVEDDGKSIQGSTSQKPVTPGWGFQFGIGYRQDTQFYQGETYKVDEVNINPGLTIPVYAPYVQMSFDINMGILIGDMPSSFVFESFGLGGQYTFFNKHVVEQIRIVAATGLGMRFISQSYKDVFSMDIYHIRPYITGGPVFEIADFLQISMIPYFGIPLYFDTNSDNDPDFLTDVPNSPGSQGGPDSTSYSGAVAGIALGSPDASLPPNRRQSYFLDESPGGVDYGLPLVFHFPYGIRLGGEVYGTSWMWPEASSWNYGMPFVGFSSGPFGMTLGVVFPLDHRDVQEGWTLSIGAGASF